MATPRSWVPSPAPEAAPMGPSPAVEAHDRAGSWPTMRGGGVEAAPEAGPRRVLAEAIVPGMPVGGAGQPATRTIPGAGEATGEVARPPVSTPELDPRPGPGPESGPDGPSSSGTGEVPWIQRLVPPRVTRPLSPEQVPEHGPGHPPAGDPDLLDPASPRPAPARLGVLAGPGGVPAALLAGGSPGSCPRFGKPRRRPGRPGSSSP